MISGQFKDLIWQLSLQNREIIPSSIALSKFWMRILQFVLFWTLQSRRILDTLQGHPFKSIWCLNLTWSSTCWRISWDAKIWRFPYHFKLHSLRIRHFHRSSLETTKPKIFSSSNSQLLCSTRCKSSCHLSMTLNTLQNTLTTPSAACQWPLAPFSTQRLFSTPPITHHQLSLCSKPAKCP